MRPRLRPPPRLLPILDKRAKPWGPFPSLFTKSAWKRNPTNFACKVFSEVRGVRQTSPDGTLCARSIRQRGKEADDHMSVARVTELSAISDKIGRAHV